MAACAPHEGIAKNLRMLRKKRSVFPARGALRLRKKIMLLTLEPDTASTVVGRHAQQKLMPAAGGLFICRQQHREDHHDCHYQR